MVPILRKKVMASCLWGAALACAGLVYGQEMPAPLPALPTMPPAPVATPVTPMFGLPQTGSPASGASQEDVNTRIERLEKQNQQLLEALQKLQSALPASPPAAVIPGGTPVSTSVLQEPAPVSKDQVQSIVADYLKAQDAKKAADEAKKKEEGFTVGKNLGMGVQWLGHQPWLETPDKAFRVHFGGRTQFDYVGTGASELVKFGTGGIGPFKDAVNFRRARLEMDGWLWETVDFFCEYDFLNTFNFEPNATKIDPKDTVTQEKYVANTPVPTDLWAGINYLPWLGTVRIGNLKNPIGLDHLTSSRYLDFIERSSGFDIYYNRQNGFVPGIMIANETENQRMTWAASLTKYNNQIYGWNVGNSEYNVTGRLTWLPYYEDNGRYMVHLGMGAQWGQPDQKNAVLRNRTLLRNGPAALHTTVGLANLDSRQVSILNPEFFMNFGPLSIQAEYISSWANDVSAFSTQLSSTKTPINQATFFSQTAYIQAMYFLTGEHRPYGKTYVHSSGPAPTRIVPYRNFYWVPGEGCPNPFSCGAWQVGARYSYADLTNNGIVGGVNHEVTLGLNWFLNPNIKFQWNYDVGRRDLDGATSSGVYHSYGFRMALDW